VRALVGPAAWLAAYDLPPGSKALAYGGPPDDPTVAHFERELWSENPIPVPEEVDPAATALRSGEVEYSHESLLAGARDVVAAFDLDEGSRVATRTPLSTASEVVAGVLAPLLAGGTITVGSDADLVVAENASGEGVLDPDEWQPTV